MNLVRQHSLNLEAKMHPFVFQTTLHFDNFVKVMLWLWSVCCLLCQCNCSQI